MAAILLRDFKPAAELTTIAETPSKKIKKRAPIGLKLYALGPSICSQRARLAIEEKGLNYEEQTLNFVQSENLEPWYLKINPRGVVPTIVENDQALFDSYTIMLYVNNQYTGPELTPADAQQYAQMIDWMKRADMFPIRDFAFRYEMNQNQGAFWRFAMYERVKAFREKNPDLKYIYDKKLADFESMEAVSKDAKSMEQLERDLDVLMDEIEETLDRHTWLVSDDLTLADIAWLPIFLRLDRIGVRVFGDGLRANIQRFVDQYKARPTFQTAIVDHMDDLAKQSEGMTET